MISKKQHHSGCLGKVVVLAALLLGAWFVFKKMKAVLDAADTAKAAPGSSGSKSQSSVGGVARLTKSPAAETVSYTEEANSTESEIAVYNQPKPIPSTPVAHSPQLNERQEKLYQLIRNEGEIGMARLSAEVKGVSTRTLRRDLTRLDKLGLIAQVGKTKDSVYKLRE